MCALYTAVFVRARIFALVADYDLWWRRAPSAADLAASSTESFTNPVGLARGECHHEQCIFLWTNFRSNVSSHPIRLGLCLPLFYCSPPTCPLSLYQFIVFDVPACFCTHTPHNSRVFRSLPERFSCVFGAFCVLPRSSRVSFAFPYRRDGETRCTIRNDLSPCSLVSEVGRERDGEGSSRSSNFHVHPHITEGELWCLAMGVSEPTALHCTASLVRKCLFYFSDGTTHAISHRLCVAPQCPAASLLRASVFLRTHHASLKAFLARVTHRWCRQSR